MSKVKKITLISIFLAIELYLYVLILFFPAIPQNLTCYASTCVCLVFSLFLLSKKADSILVQTGLFFTLISDTFLVLLFAMYKDIAMLSFSIVQILYFVRILLMQKSKKERIANIVVRLALTLIAEIAALIVLKTSFDFLTGISMFYFVNLLTNIIFAFGKNKNLLFAIGLVLFAFCDVLVSLPFMCAYLSIPTNTFLYRLAYSPFSYTWLFYLPSQVLIVLSISKNVELN